MHTTEWINLTIAIINLATVVLKIYGDRKSKKTSRGGHRKKSRKSKTR